MINLIEPYINANGDSNYDPVFPGLHLCGIVMDSAGYEQPYTAYNFQCYSNAEARYLFDHVRKAGLECDPEDAEFILDLNLEPLDWVDDLCFRRQDIDRVFEIIEKELIE